MFKKGQASIEYLVILAVVIIVALVVVAVLGGFIDIGRGSSLQAAKTYWRGAEIGLMDWKISGTTATLVVRNNQDYKIKITNATITGLAGATYAGSTIPPGGTATLTATVPSCTAGTSYSYTIAFYYNNTEQGINDKVFTGARAIEGTC